MKQIYLLLTLCISTGAIAQPTMNNALNYSIGDSIEYKRCDSSTFVPGNAGANQIWNFSSLTVIDSYIIKIENPANTSNGSQYPTSTIAQLSPGGAELYVKNSGNSYEVVGIVESSSNLNMSYNNTQKILERPVNYNDSLIDTFTSQYTYSGQSITGGGVATTKADGYGTLVLPDSTYNDVLRVRSSFFQNDSVSGSPIPININLQQTSYLWFVSAFAEPILRSDSFSISTPGPTITRHTVGYRPKLQTVGINTTTLNNVTYSCYLGNGILRIKGLKQDNQYTVALYNIAGQSILSSTTVSGSEINTIPVPNTAKGVYHLSIKDNRANQTANIKVLSY